MVSLKIRFGDDIRRISVEKLSFRELLALLRKIFDVGLEDDIIVRYIDDEGDKVTLSSDIEFKEALNCCKEPIQLYISKCPRGSDSAQPTLENLDLTLSRLLIVEQDKVNEEEKKNAEAKLARKIAEEKLVEVKAKQQGEYSRKAEEEAKRKWEEEIKKVEEQKKKTN